MDLKLNNKGTMHQNKDDDDDDDDDTREEKITVMYDGKPTIQTRRRRDYHHPLPQKENASFSSPSLLIINTIQHPQLKVTPYLNDKVSLLDMLPQVNDTVKIHYEVYICNDEDNTEHSSSITATTTSSSSNSGSTFQRRRLDSSRKRNVPLSFVVGSGQVIEGLDIAVQYLKIGQAVEIVIPYWLAFGEKGFPPNMPPKRTLIFHVEMIDFTHGDVLRREWQTQFE